MTTVSESSCTPCTQSKILVFLGALLSAIAISHLVGCRAKQQTTAANDLSRHVGKISPSDSQQIIVNALDAVVRRLPDENIYLGTYYQRVAKQRHAALPANAPAIERWGLNYARAKVELLAGNFELALAMFQEAEGAIHGQPDIVKPELLNQFYFDIGMAYLRYGETQNCCQSNLPHSCVFPLLPDTVHQDRAGSSQAIRWFQVVLDRTNSDQGIHHAARWLLNVAHMTLGQYPNLVPPPHLIPSLDRAEATVRFPQFTNVARNAGVATDSLAGGAIADDFDNDGFVDLIVSSYDPREPLRVFWNRGDGSFEADPTAVHAGIRGGLNLIQTDFNNDGLLDVFVMRGGWLREAGKHPNSLLQNLGARKFVDVSVRSGLETGESYPTQAAAWADFDLDGDLDLYVGNEATDTNPAPSQLFENLGDGTFQDIAAKYGVQNNAFAKAVTWGDFDNDGDPDLYVSNYQSPNRLYRNDREQFTDVAKSLGVDGPVESFPAWFFDADNDGHLDLFVSAYSGGIAELTQALTGQEVPEQALPKLYMSDGRGGFVDQAESRGLAFPSHPMGANFGDLNNDGFQDLYLGTGWPELHELMPNLLYCGGKDGFQDVTSIARVGHLQKGHAVAMADFDNDGDLDVFEQMGGFVPVDHYYDVLYQNPAANDSWIKLKLVGTRSNRAAIGARIRVDVASPNGSRSIHRTVNSGGSFGASSLEQHIGLGNASHIERIVIQWPFDGSMQEISAPKQETRLVIEELSGNAAQ